MATPLTRNKNGYYALRFRVHKVLLPYFNKQVIKKSLSTKDIQFAKLKASKLYYHYQRILHTVTIITSEQTQQLVDTFIEAELKQTLQSIVTVDNNKYKRVSSTTIKEAYNKYCLWYKHQNISTKQYSLITNKLVNLILPYLGEETAIDEITLEQLNEFRNFLNTFPNINKKIYKHLSFEQIVKLNTVPTEDMIGISTQLKYLTILKQFFSYMTKANLLSYNPCLLLNMPENSVPNREAFSNEEMKKIFEYTSTLDDRQFIYYTLAYTGMRPSEFWKAKIAVTDNGIFYFDLSDTSLNLKTNSSYRVIPLHKELIAMGIQHRLKRLQEEFTQAGISTYFNKTIKPKITSNKNKIMYSFRHTVATALKRADTNMDKVAEILGHTYQNSTMTKEVYAQGFTIEQLNEAINGFQYL